jgi:predicted dehydrogenase
MQAFIDRIHGRASEVATGNDGRMGLATCLGMMESSRTGQFVKIG